MVLVALVALCTVTYTYAGYPLLVALLARLAPRGGGGPSPGVEPRGAADDLPTVTVCIPAHDGAPFLAAKLESLLSLDYPADRLAVVVYSDGSTDGTGDIARAFAARD